MSHFAPCPACGSTERYAQFKKSGARNGFGCRACNRRSSARSKARKRALTHPPSPAWNVTETASACLVGVPRAGDLDLEAGDLTGMVRGGDGVWR